MKIKLLAKVNGNENDGFSMTITINKNGQNKDFELKFSSEQIISGDTKPIEFTDLASNSGYYVYKRKVYAIEQYGGAKLNEIELRIKHFALKEEKELEKITRQVEAYENLESLPNAQRERIPDNVKLFVWQRDKGQCVNCGKKDKLEFDHIIPVAEGGGNTERNIQLLCEFCNRSKGKNIIV